MPAALADLYVFSRLREGTYKAGTRSVYYQDESTVRDAADLYAVLKEQAATGSPNVENDVARAFVETIQSGQTLSNEQLAKLLELKKRHAAELRDYRASSDQSANILNTPSAEQAARARILN